MDASAGTRYRIDVGGVVQGVGFRPFVYRLAGGLGLSGWVQNHSGGVTIEAEGPPDHLDALVAALRAEAPPLAHVDSVAVRACAPTGEEGFSIRPSCERPGAHQLVSPDVATCAECLAEVRDPADRRYRYPFTNCTHCGPRFTIITALPYDRPVTTMRDFDMCPACRAEYEDPGDRRFHAQPNACPVCGPRLWLAPGGAQPARGAGLPPEAAGDAIARAARMLGEGAILAVKGLGGYQLACDATDPAAVEALRARKARPHKPLAVMMADLATVRAHCRVSAAEERLLASPECPIVLLEWRADSSIAPAVGPGNRYLGVMLPYTPLHHLLLGDVGRPLVMTSGNRSEEPIAAENDEALARLALLVDAFLMHDREIVARYDDSVWWVPDVGGEPLAQPIRRARGYAPLPIRLPVASPPLLACGAELKNTSCLARDRDAFLSPHIGDLENLETVEHLERTLEWYRRLLDLQPGAVVVDLHPDYAATRLGRALAEREGLHLHTVQHHHAHLAACLADNGWLPADGPVIGVTLDGTGYGADGHLWGGEWLFGDYRGYRRLAHLEYLPLPGGDAATRQPWRIAAGYLLALRGEAPGWLVPAGAPPEALAVLERQVARGVNVPLTSSMGRLFDAVAALLDVRRAITYEGQAAIELEMLAGSGAGATDAQDAYSYGLDRADGASLVRVAPLFDGLLDDLVRGEPSSRIARRFHATVIDMVVAVSRAIAKETGVWTAALSGGCFQNRLLLEGAVQALRAVGFRVLVHRQVPANDGGISLGQAAVAALAE
ncbi:MAG: carbamoyltransferase HypF [Chloroflexi bacterium]|nr:carbamoyltransferase HypF [Chloroflexota bacterium]